MYQVFSYHHYQNILYLVLNTVNPVITTPFDVNPKIPGPGDVTEHSNSVVTAEAQVSDNVKTTSVAMYIYTKKTTETVQAKPYEALGCL